MENTNSKESELSPLSKTILTINNLESDGCLTYIQSAVEKNIIKYKAEDIYKERSGTGWVKCSYDECIEIMTEQFSKYLINLTCDLTATEREIQNLNFELQRNGSLGWLISFQFLKSCYLV